MNKLLEQLIRDLPPAIKDLWSSVGFWRAVAILSWILVVVAWGFKTRIIAWFGSSSEHDRALFSRFAGVLSEISTRDICDELGGGSWTTEDSAVFLRALRFLELEENQFLNPSLRRCATCLRDALKSLFDFVGPNFFPLLDPSPAVVNRRYLHPGWNMDLEGSGASEDDRRYSVVMRQMLEHVRHVSDSYIAFRRAAKRYLRV